MNQKILLLLAASILSNLTLLGNNDTISLKKVDKEPVKVSMDLEINGAIKLYSVLKDNSEESTEIIYTTSDDAFINWVLHPDKDFYISDGSEIEMITPSNFKRMAKKYFAANPKLVERIGKRGFRYKNLPSMIMYYNKMMAKEGGLTKEDILHEVS